MRHQWLVCYDIADPIRLRRVYRVLRGYGDWLQFSIFRCELTDRERVVLRGMLAEVLQHDVDQVIFVDLGRTEGRGDTAIESLGRPVQEKKRVLVF